MKRGDTLVINDIQVKQDVPGAPAGSPQIPQNITGWSFWFTLKYYYSDPDLAAVAQLTSSPPTGVTITDAVNGKLLITMQPIVTRSFPDQPTKLVYDVKGKDATGNITTVDSGTLTVNPSATRAIA